MSTINTPTGTNATATPTLETLTAGIFELSDYEHIGKAEGALRLASWMFGAIATLDAIRAKAEWCAPLAKDLSDQGISINNDRFSIEHATAMQVMLLDAAHACSQTQASIEELHDCAQAVLKGGAA